MAPVGDELDALAEGDIITDVLTLIGFNNDAGRVIIFAVMALLVLIGLVSLKVPMFMGALVMVVLATAFIFLGWLPVYAFVLIALASAALMFVSIKRSESM